MKVQLHIEELILQGFEAVDRRYISAAVETELTRLFLEQGVPSTLAVGGAIARLQGDSFTITPDAKPGQIGAQVAQAIYKGMGQGTLGA